MKPILNLTTLSLDLRDCKVWLNLFFFLFWRGVMFKVWWKLFLLLFVQSKLTKPIMANRPTPGKCFDLISLFLLATVTSKPPAVCVSLLTCKLHQSYRMLNHIVSAVRHRLVDYSKIGMWDRAGQEQRMYRQGYSSCWVVGLPGRET